MVICGILVLITVKVYSILGARVTGHGKAWWNKYKWRPFPTPRTATMQYIRYFVYLRPAWTCEAEGSVTQISGWNDPLETGTRLTRNILSICMKPLPILHRSSVDSFGVILYSTLVRNREVDLIAIRTYSHTVEVLFEFLGNLMGEFAAFYWQAVPSPV